MGCESSYQDHITGCPDSVKVNALLTPGGEYFWEITDHHGNVYNQAFTAGIDGFGYIDMTTLPEGFCNPYMHGFSVAVKTSLSNCECVPLPMLGTHNSVYVRLTGGNITKNWIGCTIPNTVLEGGSTKLITVELTEESDEVQDDRLIGAEVMFVLIGGSEVDYDWTDTEVFDPTTGTHNLGVTLNGSEEAPIKLKYLIVK